MPRGEHPDYVALAPIAREGEKTRWREIGAGFKNRDGDSFTVVLDTLPLHFEGRVIVRPWREREALNLIPTDET